MSIMLRLLALRMLPVAASLLLHAAACGAIMLAPGWSIVSESIVLAELVPDPTPPAAVNRPAPPKPDPRPLKPPKPIVMPTPKPADPRPTESTKVEEPPAPPPVAAPAPLAPPAPAPTPPPVASGPAPAAEPAAAPMGRGPLAPVDAPLTSAASEGLPTHAGPPAPARPALPSVAALPPDTITQMAAPRGGYQVKPSYPATARRAGIEGTTLLSVFVSAEGRVAEVVVKESAGHPDLDAAAAEAVRRWRFDPARRGTQPVAMWVLLPVQFRLR